MNEFRTNIPIYVQVMDDIKLKIISGELKPGDKLVSIREFASELSVNPNTIQKAYSELEREGFIKTQRAVGKYVCDDVSFIKESRRLYLKDHIHEFIDQMMLFGLSKEEVIEFIEEDFNGRNDNDPQLK